jgi:hypothetical protein
MSPPQAAWDHLKRQEMEEKLSKLGVEPINPVPNILLPQQNALPAVAPHGRSASVSHDHLVPYSYLPNVANHQRYRYHPQPTPLFFSSNSTSYSSSSKLPPASVHRLQPPAVPAAPASRLSLSSLHPDQAYLRVSRAQEVATDRVYLWSLWVRVRVSRLPTMDRPHPIHLALQPH